MTQQEALQEARRRWGHDNAFASRYHVGATLIYNVGYFTFFRDSTGREHIEGSGDSWEAAFADADQKEAAR